MELFISRCFWWQFDLGEASIFLASSTAIKKSPDDIRRPSMVFGSKVDESARYFKSFSTCVVPLCPFALAVISNAHFVA